MIGLVRGPWYVPPGMVIAVGTRGAEVPIRPSNRSSRPGCVPNVTPLDPGNMPNSEFNEPGSRRDRGLR